MEQAEERIVPEGEKMDTNAFLLARQQALNTLQEEEERALGLSDAPEPPPTQEDDSVVGISGHHIGQIITKVEGTTQPGSHIGNVYEKPYSDMEKIVKEEKDGYPTGFLDYRG